jgi:hypothetical protein
MADDDPADAALKAVAPIVNVANTVPVGAESTAAAAPVLISTDPALIKAFTASSDAFRPEIATCVILLLSYVKFVQGFVGVSESNHSLVVSALVIQLFADGLTLTHVAGIEATNESVKLKFSSIILESICIAILADILSENALADSVIEPLIMPVTVANMLSVNKPAVSVMLADIAPLPGVSVADIAELKTPAVSVITALKLPNTVPVIESVKGCADSVIVAAKLPAKSATIESVKGCDDSVIAADILPMTVPTIASVNGCDTSVIAAVTPTTATGSS